MVGRMQHKIAATGVHRLRIVRSKNRRRAEAEEKMLPFTSVGSLLGTLKIVSRGVKWILLGAAT